MYESWEAPDESEQLSGEIEDILYANEESGFAVLAVMPDGGAAPVTAVGILAGGAPGERIIATGRVEQHADYGAQFKVEACRFEVPETADEVLQYLRSGVLPGIGPSTARKLVDAFGGETLALLACAPQKLAAVPGVTKETIDTAARRYIDIFDQREALSVLASLGLSPAESVALFHLYGNDAADEISRNPYLLCGPPLYLSVKRADGAAGAVSFESEGAERLYAIVRHTLRAFTENRHTCAPRRDLLQMAAMNYSVPEDMAEAALEDLIADGDVLAVDFGQGVFLYEPWMLELEKDAALRLLALCKRDFTPPANMAGMVGRLEEASGIRYAKKQKQAIETALTSGAMVITGGPGTGKTTAINAIIALFEQSAERVLLAAPTGRAAKRMSELTGHKAQTIHRLLEVDQKFGMAAPRFKRNEQNTLKCDVLIVDEMSMMDAALFDSMLRALPASSRLIMVGDADQLPSVSAGNVLPGILASLALPVVRLDEVFRQSAESLIVTNAHGVLRGKVPQSGGKKDDFFFIESVGDEAADIICGLAAARLPKAYGFSPMADIQVLCPGKNGPLGTVSLGAKLQKVLNPPAADKPEIHYRDTVFRLGDKVMHVMNNYDIPFTKTDGEPGEGAFNGDIGVIEEIDPRTMSLTVLSEDRHVHYSQEHLRQLEPAYAVTVHKSQGSEFEAVILALSGVPPLLRTRSILYTAITRAKKLCVTVGEEKVLAVMTHNARQSERYSCFCELLRYGEDSAAHITGGEQ